MKCKTKEAKLKQADSFMSMGDKFYWATQILLLGYFFKLKDISEFSLEIFCPMLIASGAFIWLGIKMNESGLKLYEEVYAKDET